MEVAAGFVRTSIRKGWEDAEIGAMFSSPKSKFWHYVKRRFFVTSNLRYMHGVLNVDEIKN